MGEIIHVCGCGREFDSDQWAALELAGYQQAEDPDCLLELRGCPCGSHRAVQLEGPGFWLELAERRASEARGEAHAECPALSLELIERAMVCLRQAAELQRMLLDQRKRRDQYAFLPAQAAE